MLSADLTRRFRSYRPCDENRLHVAVERMSGKARKWAQSAAWARHNSDITTYVILCLTDELFNTRIENGYSSTIERVGQLWYNACR